MACHVKRNVSGGPSYAFVSDSNSVDTAIVYVHGFLGHAQSTWEQLQYYVDRLDNEPFRDVDLFFYDYPAEDNFVHLSVPSLRAFLNQIFPLPPPELLEVHFRDLDWRLTDDPEVITLREHRPYSRLVLVGHSLGAVVIRRLVADEALTAHANRTTPSGLEAERLLDSELVLMAPAHLGFQPTGRTALFQILPFSAFVLRSAFLFRAFSDLQQGCHFLTQLQPCLCPSICLLVSRVLGFTARLPLPDPASTRNGKNGGMFSKVAGVSAENSLGRHRRHCDCWPIRFRFPKRDEVRRR